MGGSRTTDQKRRMMALIHYGGETPACACCGEKTIQFLSIDHIRGGGKQHLLEIGKGKIAGNRLYKWLYKNDYPSGFQVLCYNCNLSRGFYGICPHEGAEKVSEVEVSKEMSRFVKAVLDGKAPF